MAKFIFKMQSILDIKFRLEEQAKTVYANARNRLNQEEKILKEFEDRKFYYEELTRSLIQENLEERDRIPPLEEGAVATKKLNLKGIIASENGIETIKYHIKVQKVKIAQARGCERETK